MIKHSRWYTKKYRTPAQEKFGNENLEGQKVGFYNSSSINALEAYKIRCQRVQLFKQWSCKGFLGQRNNCYISKRKKNLKLVIVLSEFSVKVGFTQVTLRCHKTPLFLLLVVLFLNNRITTGYVVVSMQFFSPMIQQNWNI